MVPMPVWFVGGDFLFVLLERLVVGLVLLKDQRDVQGELTVDVRKSPSHLSNVFEDNMVSSGLGNRDKQK